MNQDEIIEMARQAGMVVVNDKFSLIPFLETFAKLVAAKEREACAKVCDDRITHEAGMQREDYENRQCAIAIRARGEA